jgi:hypothetical protein
MRVRGHRAASRDPDLGGVAAAIAALRAHEESLTFFDSRPTFCSSFHGNCSEPECSGCFYQTLGRLCLEKQCGSPAD